MARAQAQLTSTASAAKDLGLIISVSKTEYVTANCNPSLHFKSLQVYGDPINHVSGFKYLGFKMASAASDLKRRKALAWSAFWKLEGLRKGSQLSISAKMKLCYTICVTIFLYDCESQVLPLDMESTENKRVCHLLLQDHAWDKTTRLHIQHCYIFHDQHWASCVLCKKAPARFPWTHPPSSRGGACKKIMLFMYHLIWQKEAGSSAHLSHHIQRVLAYHEVEISADETAALAEERCAQRILYLPASQPKEYDANQHDQLVLSGLCSVVHLQRISKNGASGTCYFT